MKDLEFLSSLLDFQESADTDVRGSPDHAMDGVFRAVPSALYTLRELFRNT